MQGLKWNARALAHFETAASQMLQRHLCYDFFGGKEYHGYEYNPEKIKKKH